MFAGASAACALARSIPVLIAARCVQGLGGAFTLVGCLELLASAASSRPDASVTPCHRIDVRGRVTPTLQAVRPNWRDRP